MKPSSEKLQIVSETKDTALAHAQRDAASFNQFLVQAMKANLPTDALDDTEDGMYMAREISEAREKKVNPSLAPTLAESLAGKLEGQLKPRKRCPTAQRIVTESMSFVASTWWFNILAWLLLILHCVALVMIAENVLDPWASIPPVYFAFFLLELLIRAVAEGSRIWRSGWVGLDCLLAVFSLAEMALGGHCTLLAARWLHAVRFLAWWAPRECSAVIVCFSGVVPLAALMLVSVLWAFLAVVWFLLLTSESEFFASYGTSVLSQYYLAMNSLQWERITDVLWKPDQLANQVQVYAFVIVLFFVTMLATNAMIILFYEVAANAITEAELLHKSKSMRIYLIGLARLEQRFQDIASMHGCQVDWITESRVTLQMALREADRELKVLKVTAEEVLQLYDHLCDGSREAVPASELLFGVVRLVSPAGSADYLQVDHLQKQCIQFTELSTAMLQEIMTSGQAALGSVTDKVEALRTQISTLRRSAARASKDLKAVMSEVEKQYEESSVSVDRTAAMRNVQLKLAHQQARNEVSLRLEAAKADVANLEQLDVLCQVFGFPSPHDLIEGPVPSGSEVRLLRPGKLLKEKTGSDRQFQLAAALLRTEVKARLQERLERYFEDGQGEC